MKAQGSISSSKTKQNNQRGPKEGWLNIMNRILEQKIDIKVKTNLNKLLDFI